MSTFYNHIHTSTLHIIYTKLALCLTLKQSKPCMYIICTNIRNAYVTENLLFSNIMKI